ncbi:hypothetical protein [Fibrobacter sp. UWEL]|uniref:hypothetical protein n=1 Tax=Fibrobacter sp. UWEL TaxID=1896209 RepID=UPI00091F86E5|nr:hypothetical protein [Fibrobacter sp. UWEL]SHK47279.1 hypothetical protein SAMN05720468_102165 [Fibrobacter sp. UWEL]
MNQQIADIALMYVLPLGITFVAILQAASAYYRYQKLLGVIFSFLIVAMDCVFYFAQNSFIVYNCDGGLLLAFASLFLYSIILAIKSDDRPAKVGHFIFSALMFVSFWGIAYWDRPTFIPTQDYSPAEIAELNAKYQEYIASFENSDSPDYKQGKAHKSNGITGEQGRADIGSNSAALARLDSYTKEAQTVISRMRAIAEAVKNFEKVPSNINEQQRETRGRQALAISNNAVALNKKVLGLFHPHESSEAHSELIQASESVRLAAYSLYNYAIQENPEEQQNQYSQAMGQIAQMNAYIDRFWNDIENLKSNNQPQQQNAENDN